jgi:hypothetical protein
MMRLAERPKASDRLHCTPELRHARRRLISSRVRGTDRSNRYSPSMGIPYVPRMPVLELLAHWHETVYLATGYRNEDELDDDKPDDEEANGQRL